jgi:hypothetical protein
VESNGRMQQRPLLQRPPLSTPLSPSPSPRLPTARRTRHEIQDLEPAARGADVDLARRGCAELAECPVRAVGCYAAYVVDVGGEGGGGGEEGL